MMEPYSQTELPAQQSRLKRMWKNPKLEHYMRLVATVSILNVIALIYGITTGSWFTADGIQLQQISNMVIANFFIAVIIRQQYVINLLFWLATRAPTTWPLSVRWHLGKVYHHGGLHTGCAINGSLWFAVYAGSLLYHYSQNLTIEDRVRSERRLFHGLFATEDQKRGHACLHRKARPSIHRALISTDTTLFASPILHRAL